MKQFTTDRIALYEFTLVAIGCTLLCLFPQSGWLPLIIGGVPLLLRLFWRRLPFNITRFDLPVLAFLASASFAVWPAYDQAYALQKLYLIIGAVFLYLSLRNQPRRNLVPIFLILGGFGLIATTIFMLGYDWTQIGADIGFVNRFGRRWMRFRPQLNLPGIDEPGFSDSISIDGLLAILLPLSTAASIYFWRRADHDINIGIGLLNVILAISLLLTSSLTAWVAAGCGFITWIALYSFTSKKYFLKIGTLLSLLPLAIIAFGILFPVFVNPQTSPVIKRIPYLSSRLEIASNTLYLIGDYPFTGVGLNAFSGHYSQYILVIPFFMLGYSHNLYLDIALEQGILGIAIWGLVIYLTSVRLISALQSRSRQKRGHYLFTTAMYASLITMLVHGILDNPVYSNRWGLAILFLIPALAFVISDTLPGKEVPHREFSYGVFGTLAMTGIASFALFSPFNASWNANLAAVEMAKLDLADFPSDQWDDGSHVNAYTNLESKFVNSTAIDSDYPTSNYRLGQIWMLRRDFQRASEYLETALTEEPAHRGILKTLGYCYTWLGSTDKAVTLLTEIPEAENEMETYITWWENQGRQDLAGNAAEMADFLSQ